MRVCVEMSRITMTKIRNCGIMGEIRCFSRYRLV